MQKVTLYECEYCHKHYKTEEEAEKCEFSHVKTPSLIRVGYENECDIMNAQKTHVTYKLPTEVTIRYTKDVRYYIDATYIYDRSKASTI